MPFSRPITISSGPSETTWMLPAASCCMPATEPSTLVTDTSSPSSFQYPSAVGSDECAAWPTEMSFVVTAKTTFLSGLSCAALDAASAARTTTSHTRLRFIGASRPSRRDHVVGLGPEDDAFLNRLHHEMQRDPHHRQHDQDREHAGDIQGDVE